MSRLLTHEFQLPAMPNNSAPAKSTTTRGTISRYRDFRFSFDWLAGAACDDDGPVAVTEAVEDSVAIIFILLQWTFQGFEPTAFSKSALAVQKESSAC